MLDWVFITKVVIGLAAVYSISKFARWTKVDIAYRIVVTAILFNILWIAFLSLVGGIHGDLFLIVAILCVIGVISFLAYEFVTGELTVIPKEYSLSEEAKTTIDWWKQDLETRFENHKEEKEKLIQERESLLDMISKERKKFVKTKK